MCMVWRRVAASRPGELFSPRGFPARSAPLVIVSHCRSMSSPLPSCSLTKICPCIPDADGFPWGCLCPHTLLCGSGVSGGKDTAAAVGPGVQVCGQPHSSPQSRVLLAGSVTTTSVLCNLSEPPGSCVPRAEHWPDAAHTSSPCGSDRSGLAYPLAEPGKIPPAEGDAVPPQPEWHGCSTASHSCAHFHTPKGLCRCTSDCFLWGCVRERVRVLVQRCGFVSCLYLADVRK